MDRELKIALENTSRENIFSEVKTQFKKSFFQGMVIGTGLTFLTKKGGVGLLAFGYILGNSMKIARNEIVNNYF